MVNFLRHHAVCIEKNYHCRIYVEKKFFGDAHDRDRTCDRWLIRPMLYRLSYTSILISKKSIGARRELNPRPLVP